MAKSVYVLDTEVYINYFLLLMMNVTTGEIKCYELFGEDSCFSREQIVEITYALQDNTTISFNGWHFDIPILTLALLGKPCRDMKGCADNIIVHGMQYWHVEKHYKMRINKKIDHIDLIRVVPNLVGLKVLGGRMHSAQMQDLPIEPTASIKDSERELMRQYCRNDLDITRDLYNELSEPLALRRRMSAEYSMDLMSKSDPQIAEAVIKQQVELLRGEAVIKPTGWGGDHFRYKIPTWISATTYALQDAIDAAQRAVFVIDRTGEVVMPSVLLDRTVTIGKGVYRMGIGGLHSSEQGVMCRSNANSLIVSHDVTSYYPNIMMKLELYPDQMGREFLTVYGNLLNERIKAKNEAAALKAQIEFHKAHNFSDAKLRDVTLPALHAVFARAKNQADANKLSINGTYGKLGSKWSYLFSPQSMIQVTLTGQLALLMLIESMEAHGIPVLSANTDGIMVMVNDETRATNRRISEDWQNKTGFNLEVETYQSLNARDVNNYIAVSTDGSVKTKGLFAKAGISKNPANTICVEAAIALIKEGVPIETTIIGCTDVRKFISVRKVTGGAVTHTGEYLGKAVRWYYAKDDDNLFGERCIMYKTNGNLVSRSTGAKAIMRLPNAVPDDLDYDWYITEARGMLISTGNIHLLED